MLAIIAMVIVAVADNSRMIFMVAVAFLMVSLPAGIVGPTRGSAPPPLRSAAQGARGVAGGPLPDLAP